MEIKRKFNYEWIFCKNCNDNAFELYTLFDLDLNEFVAEDYCVRCTYEMINLFCSIAGKLKYEEEIEHLERQIEFHLYL